MNPDPSEAVLTDRDILRLLCLNFGHPDKLVITPIIDLQEQLHPFSFDLRLGTEFIVFERSGKTHLDPMTEPRDKNVFADSKEEVRFIKRLSPREEFVLHTNEFALGSTLEYIRLPRWIGARLDGRSVWARLGLQVHSTAGLVHPGSHGAITFELLNVGTLPIKLYPGMRIAQINFYKLSKNIIRSYDVEGSKHIGHVKASRSAYWRDKEFRYLRGMVQDNERYLDPQK
jgi:dCTP deaminase